jgi:hypothetical protein
MCSGCSGNYEGDGEWTEMRGQNSGEKRPGDSRSIGGSAGTSKVTSDRPARGALRSNFGIGGIGCDDYDVFVCEDRIVEVRRIGRFSPEVRSATGSSKVSAREKRPIFQQLGGWSAKHYGTPHANDARRGLSFEVTDNWRDPADLSVFDRFARRVRRLLR